MPTMNIDGARIAYEVTGNGPRRRGNKRAR